MANGIIILPISVVEELLKLKIAFDTQLKATDFVSENPSYLSLSDKCKEYMIALQMYMFRSIDQKGAELRRYYQKQTALQETGDLHEYAAMEEELEVFKVENHRVLSFISNETTRAGRLLMAVGTSVLRIQEKAESPEEMLRMVAGEVDASEAEVVMLREYKAELEGKQALLKH